MALDNINNITDFEWNMDEPTLLFQDGEHKIYWLGVPTPTIFRCNVYLIADGSEFVIVDPGGRLGFETVRIRVAQIVSPDKISAMILCHQDPDVAASMVDWLALNPDIEVMTSPRTHALIPHYGIADYRFYDVESYPVYTMKGGHQLKFIPAPFLHSPMAFAVYDETSRYLLTGDVFAALDSQWQLIVENMETHCDHMDLFHLEYMPGQLATKGFVSVINQYDIHAFLPQHGSIIPQRYVEQAKTYLTHLCCGLEVLYPTI